MTTVEAQADRIATNSEETQRKISSFIEELHRADWENGPTGMGDRNATRQMWKNQAQWKADFRVMGWKVMGGLITAGLLSAAAILWASHGGP